MVRAIVLVVLVALSAATIVAQEPAARHFALLVAVDEYPKAKLGKLRFAENDMAQLAGALQDAGYQEANVVRLSSTVGKLPGKERYLPNGENIRRELKQLLGSAGPRDSVLVAFSGHGVQFQGQKESYFCPADAELEKAETLLPIGELYAQLKTSAARVKILLVDACRNDPLIATSKGPEGIELEAVGRPQEVELPEGIVALFSCSSGQKAWEDTEFRHGVFFNFVIAGLKGAADKDSDGLVTYDELSTYSIAEVKQHARVKLGESQVPQQRGEFQGRISLVRVPRPTGPTPKLLQSPFDVVTAKQQQQQWASYLKTLPIKANSLDMKLVLIPPGEFLMGSPEKEPTRYDDEKQHEVRISKPFYLAQTEVTIGQFKAFVAAENNFQTEAERDGDGGWGYNAAVDKFEGPKPKYSWRSTGFPVTDEHPVVNVTWNDAQAFCAWLSRKEGKTYRLPTEAEWEYACRAGTTTIFHFGDEQVELVLVANVADGSFVEKKPGGYTYGLNVRDGYVFSSPVGEFNGNQFGLRDMHGSVWEWCQDWYGAKYYATLAGRVAVDPPGDASEKKLRVVRGGSWVDLAKNVRCAVRYWEAPTARHFYTGFRVAREP